MILITGASGTAGGAVLGETIALNLPVRAMYRSQEDAQRTPPNINAVIADFADKATLASVLEGIEAVFLVCGPVPQLVELESNMIEVCRRVGVRHIVLNSALGAGKFNKSFPKWHAQVEETLKASKLDYTIIRPNGFMQNIVAYNAPTIRKDHAFYSAMGDARVSLIDVRDVGAVVARVLREPEQHVGKIYELNGPEALSNAEIAERISRVIGTKISFVDVREAAQREAMLGAGLPEWQVTALLELQEYYRSGECASVDGTIAHLLDRSPRLLDPYLRENITDFQPA